jgi:putative IMPACT (imprinted ancient) family translation regulator
LSYDVTNVLIVVVRYFGGVKLGVRGLIDAYKNAASDALANADIIKQLIKDYYELRFEYDQMSKVMYLIKEFGLDQVETELTGSCRMVVAVRQQDSDKVKNKFEELYPLKINLVK